MRSEEWSRATAGRDAYEKEALEFENSGLDEMILACEAARVEQARQELSDEAWAAVGDLDVERLAAALERGAVFGAGRRLSELSFLNACHIVEESKESIVWTFFDAWVNGVGLKWRKSSRERGGAAESGEEQAQREQGVQQKALDVAKLLESKGWRMRGGSVQAESGASLRSERVMDMEWWSTCRDHRMEFFQIFDILVALFGEWVAQDFQAGALGLADWRDAIARMAKNNSGLALRVEKILREKTGKTLSAEGWAEVLIGASLSRQAVDALPAVEEAVKEAVAEGGALSAWSSGWLMCYAIKTNSIAMLENIARSCKKMHWRAPSEAWGWVSHERRQAMLKEGRSGEEFEPLPMFHFAILAATPSNSSWPLMSILAQSPMMRAGAEKRPSADIFGEWAHSDVARLVAAFPFVGLRDERGNSVAHAWARDIAELVNQKRTTSAEERIRATLVDLLRSEDGHLASESNDAGETVAEILASCDRGEWSDPWEEAYSEWERREMEKSAHASQASATEPGGLRL